MTNAILLLMIVDNFLRIGYLVQCFVGFFETHLYIFFLFIPQHCASRNKKTFVSVCGPTDNGRPVRKWPLLQGRKSTPTPKFLSTAEAYFVCHIGPNFQISLIYAFIGCL